MLFETSLLYERNNFIQYILSKFRKHIFLIHACKEFFIAALCGIIGPGTDFLFCNFKDEVSLGKDYIYHG
jgi:hypothetical protein